jgi:2-polyprenyl-3-methyl-5-hydroxy-6-metoxy-1,4-benzoquinol methylase
MTEPARLYEDKSVDYYRNVRTDVLPILPAFSERVLEIGCGDGHTLAFLKASGRCGWVCGVDPFSHPESTSHFQQLDVFLNQDIEKSLPDVGHESIDLILCLDVLEHLVDPWRVVRDLLGLLKPGGHIVVSLPNVRHYSVVLPLVLSGRWRYAPSGIMDATHLRFFTKESALALLADAGVVPVRTVGTGLTGRSKARFANLVTLGLFRRFFEYQYLVAAVKPAHPQAGNQPR